MSNHNENPGSTKSPDLKLVINNTPDSTPDNIPPQNVLDEMKEKLREIDRCHQERLYTESVVASFSALELTLRKRGMKGWSRNELIADALQKPKIMNTQGLADLLKFCQGLRSDTAPPIIETETSSENLATVVKSVICYFFAPSVAEKKRVDIQISEMSCMHLIRISIKHTDIDNPSLSPSSPPPLLKGEIQ